uniref:Protein disulfide isomerase family A member 6 n=1 Tax=Rousettus aegyptiacus TaxID=9407 RepID=A0A7J8FKV4_ROUAE|nr:protein disulfide isomerase family A member 6 [Rousettus aegyptiacus]
MTGGGQGLTSSPGPSICFLTTRPLLSCMRSSTRTSPRRRARSTSSAWWPCCRTFLIPELQAEIPIWMFF